MEEQIIKNNALPVNPKLLLPSINDSQIVMIGDSTHGTSTFYQFRAEMSKSLILEKGFTIIGIEWDWIDVARINQYIHGHSGDKRAWDAISPIERFPTFMYENHPFEEFIEWLKRYNQTTSNKVSIYGLDIFGIIKTLNFLLYNLPNQEDLIQRILNVWKNFNPIEYNYGNAVNNGTIRSLENEVNQLQFTGNFFLDQCIALVKEGEKYYRIKVQNDTLSWNLRDGHMTRVIIDLLNYTGAKMICWLHNTHSGLNSIREFKDHGKTTAATLLKQSFGSQVYSIGLLAYIGTVTASNHWYGNTLKFNLNKSIEGSYEKLFHDALQKDFMLILKNGDSQLLELLSIPRYERFIGGVYNPNNEMNDHYVYAQIYPQFDSFIFFDNTNSF